MLRLPLTGASDIALASEPLDGPVASPLLAAYAGEIAELYPGWHPGIGPRAEPADFAPPGGRFLVAFDRGQAVGCGGIKRLDGEAVELKRLYVAPGARGGGLARKLVAALEDSARELGYSVVRLDTGARQPAALALFRSCGYGDIADYNGNPVAAFWLEKRLA